jgi:hypothetical protein
MEGSLAARAVDSGSDKKIGDLLRRPEIYYILQSKHDVKFVKNAINGEIYQPSSSYGPNN